MCVCVTGFSGTTDARILKRGILMDNELLYHGIANRAYCSHSSFYLSIVLSFQGKFVTVVSELHVQAIIFKHSMHMENE